MGKKASVIRQTGDSSSDALVSLTGPVAGVLAAAPVGASAHRTIKTRSQ